MTLDLFTAPLDTVTATDVIDFLSRYDNAGGQASPASTMILLIATHLTL